VDLDARGQDVAAVDDAGVELARRDLGEQAAHVGLLGVGGGGDPRGGEDLTAEVAARHLGRAQPDEQVGVAEGVEAPDVGGVAGRDRDLEGVAGEDLGLVGRSGVDHLVHVRGVRGGEDVGGGPGQDLLAQGLRPREVELDGDAGVGLGEGVAGLAEGVGERGRGEDRDRTVEVGRRRPCGPCRRIVATVVAAGGRPDEPQAQPRCEQAAGEGGGHRRLPCAPAAGGHGRRPH
jgi:hypothetical protein